MKAWIVHDSQFGNGENLAKTLGKTFEKEMEVNIGHIKNTPAVKVVTDSPDIVVVGAAVRAFVTCGASKKWINQLHTELKKADTTIDYGVTFLTHAMPKKMINGKGKRLNKRLAKSPNISKVYPEFLSGQVIGQEGPFKEYVLPDIERHAAKIVKWMKK